MDCSARESISEIRSTRPILPAKGPGRRHDQTMKTIIPTGKGSQVVKELHRLIDQKPLLEIHPRN